MYQQRKQGGILAGLVIALVLAATPGIVVGQSSVPSQPTTISSSSTNGLVTQAGLLWSWFTNLFTGESSTQMINVYGGGGGCPFRICTGGGGTGGNNPR